MTPYVAGAMIFVAETVWLFVIIALIQRWSLFTYTFGDDGPAPPWWTLPAWVAGSMALIVGGMIAGIGIGIGLWLLIVGKAA
jgi:hypothetical protein